MTDDLKSFSLNVPPIGDGIGTAILPRDGFALACMTVLFARDALDPTRQESSYQFIAETSYRMADAMMAARKSGTPGNGQ